MGGGTKRRKEEWMSIRKKLEKLRIKHQLTYGELLRFIDNDQGELVTQGWLTMYLRSTNPETYPFISMPHSLVCKLFTLAKATVDQGRVPRVDQLRQEKTHYLERVQDAVAESGLADVDVVLESAHSKDDCVTVSINAEPGSPQDVAVRDYLTWSGLMDGLRFEYTDFYNA